MTLVNGLDNLYSLLLFHLTFPEFTNTSKGSIHDIFQITVWLINLTSLW
jgi:hypothetical protein